MRQAARIGVPAGIAAGAVMAAWSMVAMWLTGSGFWLPLNLIAHTFYRAAPLDSTFSGPALIIGFAVHMTVAAIFGVVIALLVQHLPGRRSLVIAGGALFIAVVWPVMQYGIWYSIDEPAAEGFNDWIFAIAHLTFGVLAAGIASVAVTDESRTRGRPATVSGPQRAPALGSLFQPRHRQ